MNSAVVVLWGFFGSLFSWSLEGDGLGSRGGGMGWEVEGWRGGSGGGESGGGDDGVGEGKGRKGKREEKEVR